MKENQFTVDLGDIKLTDEQRSKINLAVQTAITGELATIATAGQVALIPVGGHHGPKWPGPIIWGIIVRPINNKVLKELELIA